MEAVAAAAAAVDAAAAAAPLIGRRVRVEGLAARPELNGRCGEATAYDATRERYCVAVEGEPSPVLLRPDNLTAIGHTAAAAATPSPRTTGLHSATGYFRVTCPQKVIGFPFEVIEPGGLNRNGKRRNMKRLGKFRTAAEGALWYARYLGPLTLTLTLTLNLTLTLALTLTLTPTRYARYLGPEGRAPG